MIASIQQIGQASPDIVRGYRTSSDGAAKIGKLDPKVRMGRYRRGPTYGCVRMPQDPAVAQIVQVHWVFEHPHMADLMRILNPRLRK